LLKLLGALLIVGASSISGILIANKYRQRPLELRNLRSMLNLLETEIVFTSTPLPLALEKIAKHADSNIAQLFAKTRDYLLTENGITADEAWQRALHDFMPESYLIEEDLGILQNFGIGLGCSDRNEQLKNIQLVQELLKQQELKAETNRCQNERLWKTMGFLTGVAIVLLIY